MANYKKAPKLIHKGNKNVNCKSIIMIPSDLLEIVFNTLTGRQGNVIKLIIFLIGTAGDGSFGISEKWICDSTGMLKSCYIEARKTLKELGWLEVKNGKIYLDFNAIRGKKQHVKDFSKTCNDIYESASTKEKQYIDILLSKYDKKQDNISVDEKYVEIHSAGRLDCFIAYANRMIYSEYLETNYWHMITCEKKYSVGKICQICSAEKRLQVHHNKYDHRGQEHLFLNEDLVCLCDSCHKKFHDIGGEVDG